MIVRSQITFYRNIGFFSSDSYVIDDFEDFLSIHRDLFILNRAKEIKIQLENEIKVYIEDLNASNVTIFKGFNYVKIVNYKESEGANSVVDTAYYFVQSIVSTSDYVFSVRLLLDVLNTYLGLLFFTNKTFVIREHQDRFLGAYVENDNSYRLLLNISGVNEGFPNALIPFEEFALTTDPDNTNPLASSWVKVVRAFTQNDQTEVLTGFLPYEQNVTIRDGNNTYILYSFKYWILQGKKDIFTDVNVWSVSIIPYPPINEFNSFYKDEVIDVTNVTYRSIQSFNNSFTMIYFDFNQTILTPPSKLIVNQFYGSGEDFNHFLFDKLTISLFRDDFNKLYRLDDMGLAQGRFLLEPAVRRGEFFKVKISFGSFEYFLTLDNLDVSIDDFIDLMVHGVGNNDIINIQYSPFFSVEKGFTLFFKSGDICPLIGGDNSFTINELAELPMYSDNYRNYVNSGNYAVDKQVYEENKNLMELRFQEEQNNKSSILGLVGNYVRAGITFGFSKIIGASRLIGAFTRTFEQFFDDNKADEIHTKEMLIQDLNYQRNIQSIKFNNLNLKNIGNFESTLRLNNNLIKCVIEKVDFKTEQKISDYYYFYGNEVNQYKIPSHNNRVIFDFLKCDPVFENYSVIMDYDIINIIVEKLRRGVTYIHKFNNKWFFDYNGVENIERNISIYGEQDG